MGINERVGELPVLPVRLDQKSEEVVVVVIRFAGLLTYLVIKQASSFRMDLNSCIVVVVCDESRNYSKSNLK